MLCIATSLRAAVGMSRVEGDLREGLSLVRGAVAAAVKPELSCGLSVSSVQILATAIPFSGLYLKRVFASPDKALHWG